MFRVIHVRVIDRIRARWFFFHYKSVASYHAGRRYIDVRVSLYTFMGCVQAGTLKYRKVIKNQPAVNIRWNIVLVHLHRSLPCYRTSILVYTNIIFTYRERDCT